MLPLLLEWMLSEQAGNKKKQYADDSLCIALLFVQEMNRYYRRTLYLFAREYPQFRRAAAHLLSFFMQNCPAMSRP